MAKLVFNIRNSLIPEYS